MKHTSFLKNGLSGFELKIFACTFMMIDHIGIMLLPNVELLRIIGRFSYPLFAYFIAEGTRYTKNRVKRFLSIFILGVICEISFVVFSSTYSGNILLTFSVSVLLIYLLDYTKKEFFKNRLRGFLFSILFVLSLCATYFYCECVGLDYGFFGVIAPVFCSACDNLGELSQRLYSKISRKYISIAMFTIGLLLVVIFDSVLSCQVYCLFSVLLLMLYNGERGKYSFKYGFYLFYPVHFLVLQAIVFLIK